MTIPVQIKDLKIGEGMPKVCVPLTAVSTENLCEEAKMVKAAKPDLVEWRADFYEDLFEIPKMIETLKKLQEILAGIPLLFTIRTKAEGGKAAISMKDYVEINLAAALLGKADLVDVEVFSEDMTCSVTESKVKATEEIPGRDSSEMCMGTVLDGDLSGINMELVSEKIHLIERIHETETKVIASSHDFVKTDSKNILLERFCAMQRSGADILKMAVMPKCEDDVKAIMEITDRMRKEFTDRPLVSMSMGELGAVSRIEGEGFGSSVTFATVGAASAPGQIPIGVLRDKIKIFHGEQLY